MLIQLQKIIGIYRIVFRHRNATQSFFEMISRFCRRSGKYDFQCEYRITDRFRFFQKFSLEWMLSLFLCFLSLVVVVLGSVKFSLKTPRFKFSKTLTGAYIAGAAFKEAFNISRCQKPGAFARWQVHYSTFRFEWKYIEQCKIELTARSFIMSKIGVKICLAAVQIFLWRTKLSNVDRALNSRKFTFKYFL